VLSHPHDKKAAVVTLDVTFSERSPTEEMMARMLLLGWPDTRKEGNLSIVLLLLYIHGATATHAGDLNT
jgi:hypothetical protein